MLGAHAEVGRSGDTDGARTAAGTALAQDQRGREVLRGLLSLMVKNARRNPLRTSLTTFGLSVSLFLFTSLIAVVTSLDGEMERAGQNPLIVVTHKSGWAHVMPERYTARIRRIPGVVRIGRSLFYGGSYGQSRGPQDSFASMGTDGDDPRKIWGDQLVIAPGAFACFERTRAGALVGSQLIEKHRWRIGQQVTLSGAVWPVDLTLTLCGAANFATDKASFVFHREYLEAALGSAGLQTGLITMFAVQVRSVADIPAVARRIHEEFATSPAPVRAVSQRAFIEGFMSVMGNIQGMVSGVVLLVLVVVLLLVANSIAMTTRDRTRELALLKAIGFQPRHVVALILGEAATLGALGALGGCGGAYAAFGGTGFSLGIGMLSGLAVRPTTLAYGLCVSVLVSMAASVVPAWRVLGLRVAEGLRHST